MRQLTPQAKWSLDDCRQMLIVILALQENGRNRKKGPVRRLQSVRDNADEPHRYDLHSSKLVRKKVRPDVPGDFATGEVYGPPL